ncbi:MAG: type IV pilus assembly protein PilM [Candidatus Methylomirabilia bacterium]
MTLGIDIGSFSLKAVKLERKSSGLKAVKIAYSRIPRPEATGEDEILSLVKDFVERNGLLKEHASLTLPGAAASVRFFSLPKMPREELAQAVAWEAAKHASLPVEDLVADFVTYEPTPGLPDGQQQVMAVMVPRATVERWVENFSRIGLRLAAIDIPAMALLAYTDLYDPWDKHGCGALLDLGHTRTGIHLFQDRHLCFSRDIAIGGSDISQALADVLHVDARQADDLKQRFGVAGEGPEGEKVRQILEQVLERIAVEVQRSFDYYQAQFREASFGKVRLCGGTALLPGSARYFSEALRLESRVDLPWQIVPLDPKAAREDGIGELGPVFSTAIGLATRRTGQ